MNDTERTCEFKAFEMEPCGKIAQFRADRSGDPAVTGIPRSVNQWYACGRHLAWAVTDLEDGDGYVVPVISLSSRSEAARAFSTAKNDTTGDRT